MRNRKHPTSHQQQIIFIFKYCICLREQRTTNNNLIRYKSEAILIRSNVFFFLVCISRIRSRSNFRFTLYRSRAGKPVIQTNQQQVKNRKRSVLRFIFEVSLALNHEAGICTQWIQWYLKRVLSLLSSTVCVFSLSLSCYLYQFYSPSLSLSLCLSPTCMCFIFIDQYARERTYTDYLIMVTSHTHGYT